MSCLPAYVAMRTGELPFSSLALPRAGCAASRSPTAFVSPRRMTPSNSATALIGPRRRARDESGAWIANCGLRPCERRRRLLDDLVPRTGEATLGALFRKRLLTMPLTAGQLVVDLEPVPVGIREVDADRDGVVRDADGHVFGLQPLIHFREVFEAPHSPGHVVQAHLLLLRSQGVFAHLEEGDVMRMARVAREEGCAQLVRTRKGHGILRVEAEDVRIPLVRALGVAHEDVDVVERNGLVGHVPVSCEQNRVSGEYTPSLMPPRDRGESP